MLFGVMLTSLLMENFSKMIVELRNLNKPHDESDRFHLFLGTMKKLNGDQSLPKKLTQEMEQYLQFRWQNDRNLAISTQEDFAIFSLLPGKVQTEFYVTYLYRRFLSTYN